MNYSLCRADFWSSLLLLGLKHSERADPPWRRCLNMRLPPQCPPDTTDPRRVRWALPSETPENCCYSSSYTVLKRSNALDSMKFTFCTLKVNFFFSLIILWVYSHTNLEPSSQWPLATWQASARYGEAFLCLQRSPLAASFCVDRMQTSAESWSFSEKSLCM